MKISRCRDFQMSVDQYGVVKMVRSDGKAYLVMMRKSDYRPFTGRILHRQHSSHGSALRYRDAVRHRLISFVAHEPIRAGMSRLLQIQEPNVEPIGGDDGAV